ncbi:hypothetical protein VIGAN_01253800 [Vigna angularis var. angularis]|uniref:Uncharacterized protein n=1 Tax=Vigna angularis var. angularis TaxID=157739 RepID=A0A0S3R2I0_PHAAN|nr:hypothetical protein VIGAN_01253800 [Vigna angularis var. angularis]
MESSNNNLWAYEWLGLHGDCSRKEFPRVRRFCSLNYTTKKIDVLFRTGESEKEPNASKRSSSFRLEFRTPNSSPGPYPKSDDKNLRYLYDESRSPRYAQKYSRNGGHIRSPIQIEVVDDMYKDDERRNRRLANIEAKLKKTSSDDLKKVETVAAPLAEVSKETTPVVHYFARIHNKRRSSDMKAPSSLFVKGHVFPSSVFLLTNTKGK